MKQLRNILKVLLFVGVVTTLAIASETKNLAVVYTFDEINDERFDDFAKKDLKEIGFYLNDPHRRVNDAYKDQFGITYLDLIGFSSMFNDKVVRPLLNKDPRIGGFSPFNLLHFRKKSDMKTVVMHLTPEAMLDILEISDEEIRKPFIASFKPFDALIEEKLGGKKSYLPFQGLAKDTMMNFEIPFGEPEDIDDFLDNFQEKFEYTFETEGFVVAGFYNVKYSFNSEDDVMSNYRTFWSYDLCHIPFSYAIFDGVNAMPEAGIFAPCSMYVYVKKDENKIVIGMPTLNAWAAALGINDAEKMKYINQLDEEIPAIIKSLGGVAVANGNPLLKK